MSKFCAKLWVAFPGLPQVMRRRNLCKSLWEACARSASGCGLLPCDVPSRMERREKAGVSLCFDVGFARAVSSNCNPCRVAGPKRAVFGGVAFVDDQGTQSRG